MDTLEYFSHCTNVVGHIKGWVTETSTIGISGSLFQGELTFRPQEKFEEYFPATSNWK